MPLETTFTNLTSEQKAKAKVSTSMDEIAQLAKSVGVEFCDDALDAVTSDHRGFHCMSVK